MKSLLLKTGAYLLLIIGIILSLGAIFFGIYFFLKYPEVSISKKIIPFSAFVIIGIFTILVSFSLFETIIDNISIQKFLAQKAQDGK